MVQVLLDAKADANGTAMQGFTPLIAAVTHNRQAVVQVLLEGGALPNLCPPADANATPLSIALEKGFTEIADLLRERGAAVSCRPSLG